MARFMAGKSPAANQIEFVNLIVDHLTEHGVVEPITLYESPFTDLTPRAQTGCSARSS
jgi:type I restriction enzyme, R subunit